jgi:hypothetical protein
MIFMANIDTVDAMESTPYIRGSFRQGYCWMNDMKIFRRMDIKTAVLLLAMLVAPALAFGQTDEIQVYDAAIAEQGKFNLTWHNNFTPNGLKNPAFVGALTPDKTLNGVTEWAYGVTRWFEAGLYMPLYSIARDRGAAINGGKLRALFVVPNADDRKFIYGVNFEFSYNSKHWDSRRITSEVRPIIGWHLHPLDVIINPIVDTTYAGGFGSLEFVPAIRVAHNLTKEWALALEEYDDYGPLRHFNRANEQAHQMYFVVDHDSKVVNVEAGVGVGMTSASDKLTLKLILSRDLN